MNENVRTDNLLGKPKVIVGNSNTDLVLETLGKVYIKTGRKLQLLDEMLKHVVKFNPESDTNKIILMSDISELETLEYPGEGYFIYVEDTYTLYISIKGSYVALIQADHIKNEEYVKKSGDTMTGPLDINTHEAPLILHSSKLIKNLNANYLNGNSADSFTKKADDETIKGNWSFNGNNTSNGTWVFNKNVRHKGDIILDKNISSPEFASGYSGYGWRLDSDTNTLTIDNLVVRKAMKVFELIINQISATNGSLWVSNSSKIESVYKINIVSNLENVSEGYYVLTNDIYYESVGNDNLANSATTNVLGGYNENNGLSAYGDSLEDNITQLYAGRDNLFGYINKLHYISPDLTRVYDVSNSINTSLFIEYEIDGQQCTVFPYYKYFGSEDLSNYYVIDTDPDTYPLFKAGDLLRCQKYEDGEIKYYDALVIDQLKDRSYLIQTSSSVFDKYTEISYTEEGEIFNIKEEYNETLYNKTNKRYNTSTKSEEYISSKYENVDGTYNGESSLGGPKKGDDLIQIGNLQNKDRQGSIYLTSTDDQGPYIDVMDGLNRPDYSVLYKVKIPVKYTINYYGQEYTGYIKTEDPMPLNYTLSALSIYVSPDNKDISLEEKEGWTHYTGACLYETLIPGCLGYFKYSKPVKVRLGKLDGIYNPIFGNRQPHGYGLYGENVYLTGEFYLNNGKSVASFADDIELIVGDINTNIDDIKNNYVSNNDLESAGMHISEDQIVLWADAVKIATEKTELGNSSNYTALFSDGKLSAQVFEAISYTNEYNTENYEIVIDTLLYPLLGYIGKSEYNEESTLSIDGTLVCAKIDGSKGYNIYNGTDFYSREEVSQFELKTIPDGTTSILFKEKEYSKKLGNLYIPGDYIRLNPYPIMTINKLGKGECIYYYPSGFVMNCKVFKNNNNNQVSGCIEYFFNDYTCILADIREGYDSLKEKYPKEDKGCVKIIDYFTEEINDITLSTVEFYKWYVWDSSYKIHLGPYTTVNKLSNSSEDILKIAQRCKNSSEKFTLYYIKDLEESGDFTYNDTTYNVKNYLYNSVECSNCIANILTNGITSDLFTKWESYIDLSDFITTDTNNIESTDTTQCFIKGYNVTSLTMIPIAKEEKQLGKQPISDLLNRTIAVFYINNSGTSITPI